MSAPEPIAEVARDDQGEFLLTGFGFTFERGVGVVLHEDGSGCPIWYREGDSDRAFSEAANPGPHVDWSTMTLIDHPAPESPVEVAS